MATIDVTRDHDRLHAATDAAPRTGLVSTVYKFLSGIPTWILWIIVILWTTPTLSLFVNSFRGREDQRSSVFWRTTPDQLTMDNYSTVWNSQAAGGLKEGFVNSFAIAIPATIIPIAIAAFAAYAFAWIEFRGRELMFIGLVSLLAIPNQVALLPLLQTYAGGAHQTIPFTDKTITLIPDLGLQGTSNAVWLSHIGFALPFAVFLLHNYMKSLPKDIFESARIDGADHFTIFWRLVLPLSIPVLAAFAIFQFLWTWNDYLIATTMLGAGGGGSTPLTVRIAALVGEFGRNEHLLTAGAFVMSAVPLLVFFALQKYFVRGLLAGSVKG